ncbi:MAG: serine/threonine-protein kinase [bacterium]
MDHVTLIRPDPRPPSDARGLSSALPPDLLEQVRGRVRLLALFLFAAFAFDPVTYFAIWEVANVLHKPLDAHFFAALPFEWVNMAAAAASVALWWLAGRRRVSPSHLHTIGLVYEVAICFVIAMITFWQSYNETKALPNLTWVPAVVILFPLIMPGPPLRMLAAAIAAGAMAPFSLVVLKLLGKVPAIGDGVAPAIVGSTFAIFFAYMGARVIYGLGREVAAARELGSYRLEEKLGQGGMGEVWRAKHRLLARPAAIKVIRPNLAADGRAGRFEDLRRRFEREAQVTASLRSPHTVGLYDFGVADDGSFYYVMELLDGLDTDTLVKRFGPLPAERVVHVLRQICHSLSEADSRGLVHRDIKPANIFLCRYGEEHDFVKVLDFGLVKALGDGSGSGGDGSDAVTALTRENAIHGTPAFIAPEQALGKAELDGRVDIYATGCVAYWLLTGQLVFAADTPMGLLMQHVNEKPVAPSMRTEMKVPEALDQLVIQCLAKDPKERPQSARELMGMLGDVEGVGEWTEERAKDWWEKHQPGS